MLKYAPNGINKEGLNPDIDIASEEDIWNKGGNYVSPTQARVHNIVSDDANDDGIASGTLTLSSVTAVVAATGTITAASVQAGDTVTVNGLVYTAVSGAKADNTEFTVDGGDTAVAADLADSITNDTRSGTLGDVTAANVDEVVTCTSDQSGTAGNAVTLVSSNGTRLAVSGSGTFTGGLNADVATVNGLTYTAVTGAKADNTEFSVDGGDNSAATDLAASITNDTRTGITVPGVDVEASASTNVVTIDALTGGTAGNLIDISGTSNITASGATLTDAGTGARSVFIKGVDANYAEISETVFLNGTTARPTTNSYLEVNELYVNSAGSGGQNAGLVTATAVTDGTVSAQILATQNEASMAIYTVPANRDVMITKFQGTPGLEAASMLTLKLLVREFGLGFTQKAVVHGGSTGGGVAKREFEPWLKIPARSQIKLRGGVSTDNTPVSGSFDLKFSEPNTEQA